jgi:hypothetical protein
MTQGHGGTQLIVLEAEHFETRLIVFDFITECLHLRIINRRQVSIHEAAAQLDVLTWC